jgi:hypothetical protein
MIRRRPVEALLSKSARKRHLMQLQTANARCEKCDNGARMCPSSSSYEPSDLLFSRTVAALLTVPPLISFSPAFGSDSVAPDCSLEFVFADQGLFNLPISSLTSSKICLHFQRRFLGLLSPLLADANDFSGVGNACFSWPHL